jgi:transposase InsO family protein
MGGALPTRKSTQVVDWLKHTFEGQYFKIWQSDNGVEFKSEQMKEFVKSIGGRKPVNSTPYHPQTNGHIERLWGTLKPKLRIVSKQKFKQLTFLDR